MKLRDGKPPAIKSIAQCFYDSNVKIVSIKRTYKVYGRIEAMYIKPTPGKNRRYVELATLDYLDDLSKQYLKQSVYSLKIFING